MFLNAIPSLVFLRIGVNAFKDKDCFISNSTQRFLKIYKNIFSWQSTPKNNQVVFFAM